MSNRCVYTASWMGKYVYIVVCIRDELWLDRYLIVKTVIIYGMFCHYCCVVAKNIFRRKYGGHICVHNINDIHIVILKRNAQDEYHNRKVHEQNITGNIKSKRSEIRFPKDWASHAQHVVPVANASSQIRCISVVSLIPCSGRYGTICQNHHYSMTGYH